MDLLTTYTQHLELQVITALSLNSTLQITTAPDKPLSSLLSSSAIPWQWL
jgi:hypothetical protein